MKAFPRDVEVATMTTRHIGVENELSISEAVTSRVERELMKLGLLQSIGWDGGGREFRTNPISIRSLKQVRGFRCITEYYGVIARSTRVVQSGGTHIHISILNTDHPNMESNATAIGAAFYTQFQKIAGRHTTWASRFPRNTIDGIRDFLESNQIDNRRYYRTGRMLGPTDHQTLEFRGPKGSNNRDEILAWAEFLDNVVKAANRESVEGMTFKRLLRGKRIQAYVASLPDKRKFTEAELNQKFNGSKLY